MESHRGADALPAQDVATLMRRLAEYTPGPVLQWEESERVRPDREASAYVPPSSMRTPRTACFCQAHDCRVELLPEWIQSASVYPRLDRGGLAVTAGQR